MAISTATELQAAVLAWIDRVNDPVVSARIADFVTLFEGEAKTIMDHRLAATRSQNAAVASEYVSLPSDFLHLKSAILTGTRPQPLEIVPDEVIGKLSSGKTGTPQVVSVVSSTLRFYPTPADQTTVEIVYHALPSLNSQASNWLLAFAPSVYLFGVSEQARLFLFDKDGAAMDRDKWLGLAEALRKRGRATQSASSLQPIFIGNGV